MRKLTKFKAAGSGSVDRESGIIRGVSLIHGGNEALGHGMFIDRKMVNQVVKFGKETGDIGLKARFDHPSACFSSMGTQLGRFKNFRRSGDKALADLHIADFAATSPQGDLRTHVLDVAEEDPEMIGFSIVFVQAEPVMVLAKEGDDPESPEFSLPHARIDSLHACDVVDEPAANPGGMFSVFGRPDYMAEQVTFWAEENPELLQQLLEPALKVYNDNINQKSINMSDNKKSFTAELVELTKKHFSKSEEVVDVPATDEVKDKDETVDTDLSSKNDEIEALKATILSDEAELEAKEAVFTAKSEELDALKASTELSTEAFNAEIEKLKKVSLGNVVEAVATDDDSVEISDEAKAERKDLSRVEQIHAWSHEPIGTHKI